MSKGESTPDDLEEQLTMLRHHIDCIDRGQTTDDLGHDINAPKEEIQEKMRSLLRALDREAYGEPDKPKKKSGRGNTGGR